MIYQIINGSGYPVVHIHNVSDGSLLRSINLDYCNFEGGEKENYKEDFKRITLEKNNRFLDYSFKAARITFTLDYSQLAEVSNLMNIESIYYYHSLPDLYFIRLQPRSDVISRQFEVRIDGEYSLGKLPDNIGHTDTVITFITTETVGKQFTNLDYTSIRMNFFIHN